MPRYREIADDLRQRIEGGEFPPGSTLPHTRVLMEDYGASKQTVRTAIDELVKEGTAIAKRRHGTFVRDRREVRIALSRYKDVLDPSTPGGGPFESACAAQGLNGFMNFVDVQRVQAPEDLAALLELTEGDTLVFRRRDALIDTQVVQIQHAWYPIDVAEAAGLDRRGKIEGGIYRALEAAGISATTATETVRARMPTREEAAQLGTGTAVPLLTIERVSRDANGRPIEVLRVMAAADRMALTYDDLPLRRPTA